MSPYLILWVSASLRLVNLKYVEAVPCLATPTTLTNTTEDCWPSSPGARGRSGGWWRSRRRRWRSGGRALAGRWWTSPWTTWVTTSLAWATSSLTASSILARWGWREEMETGDRMFLGGHRSTEIRPEGKQRLLPDSEGWSQTKVQRV